MEGIAVKEEEFSFAMIKYRPHYILTPTYPHLTMTSRLVDPENLVYKVHDILNIPNRFTKAIGTVELDCIAFRREFHKTPLFGFATFVDRYVVYCVFLCVPILATIFANKTFKTRIWFYLQILFESLFCFTERFECRFYLLFSVWMTILWLFRQYFSSDMLAELTQKPRLKVLDSWADLSKQRHLKVFGVKDVVGAATIVGEAERENYFNIKSEFYEDFTERLEQVSAIETQRSDLIEVGNDTVDITRFDGNVVLMDVCDTLRYRAFKDYCGRSRDRVHVSKEGGDMVPYFLVHTFLGAEIELVVINFL